MYIYIFISIYIYIVMFLQSALCTLCPRPVPVLEGRPVAGDPGIVQDVEDTLSVALDEIVLRILSMLDLGLINDPKSLGLGWAHPHLIRPQVSDHLAGVLGQFGSPSTNPGNIILGIVVLIETSNGLFLLIPTTWVDSIGPDVGRSADCRQTWWPGSGPSPGSQSLPWWRRAVAPFASSTHYQTQCRLADRLACELVLSSCRPQNNPCWHLLFSGTHYWWIILEKVHWAQASFRWSWKPVSWRTFLLPFCFGLRKGDFFLQAFWIP